jgi:peptide/nickel transport system substrate-binding protein
LTACGRWVKKDLTLAGVSDPGGFEPMKLRMRYVRRLRLVVFVVVASMLAAACSSDDDNSGQDQTDGTTTTVAADDDDATTTTAAADDDADASGEVTFVYAAAGVPETLDVWSTYQGDPSRLQMYEWGSKLVYYDATSLAGAGCDALATTENVRPGLAESWEVADDGTITFTLREGVMSAAGNEMTADDAVRSWNRAREQSGVVRFLVDSVSHFAEENAFEVVDDRTVQVNVDRGTALDVSLFTYPMFMVHDWTAIDAAATGDTLDDWYVENTANYGPWVLESFTPGEEAVYTVNPNYWDEGRRGNIDRLIVRNVSESSIRSQLLATGEADYAERLSFQETADLQTTDGVDVLSCVSPNRDTLTLNTQFEPFADPDVRRAISLAINRDALVQGVYQGFAVASTTGMSPIYLEDTSGLSTFEYDPDQARQILEDKGITDLSFTITASPTRPGAHAESLAVQIQAFMSDVGINAQVVVVPGSTDFSDRFFAGEYEGVVYLEPPALADPYYSANLYNTTVSFQNTHMYDNPEYDSLTAQIEQTPPGADRQALIRELSDLIVQDVPMVYLVERSYGLAFANGVGGYLNTPHGAILAFQMTKN